MAKTTRKTEPTSREKKPATRRAKAAPAAGAEKPAAVRRTKAAPEAAAPPARNPIGSEPTHDEIALRAWSIYQQRGASHGDANRDWLEALEALRRERGLTE